jgi:hypothetical protein
VGVSWLVVEKRHTDPLDYYGHKGRKKEQSDYFENQLNRLAYGPSPPGRVFSARLSHYSCPPIFRRVIVFIHFPGERLKILGHVFIIFHGQRKSNFPELTAIQQAKSLPFW